MVTVSKNNLYRLAEDFKKYVEAGEGIPYKFTYDGITYYTKDMVYIFTYGLYHLKGGFEVPVNIKWPKNANGEKIVEKIYEDDYKRQAKNMYNHIKKNDGQPPNSTRTIKSKKLVNIDLYAYCLAKILVYYKKEGEFPDYCLYDYKAIIPKPKYKKHGRSTKSGCDNRGQNNGVYCGPHMAQEIVRNLTGIVVPQATIASVMGTTSAGTGHGGIETFFAWFNRNYGYNLKVEWKNFSDLGWSGIKKILESDDKDMGAHELYRDTWGHYTNFDEVYDNSIDVHNSLGSSCGSCYCGYTENRSKSTAERYMNGISQKSILVVTRG